MVDAAERRKARERRRLAGIIAYGVNSPDKLDEVAPEPERRRPAEPQASDGSFEREQWW